jgi:hypothetical protein
MPGAMPPTLAPAAELIAPDDLARADRVARRLHSEITTFLNSVPPEARNASGLARYLDIDRTTCQRAVFSVSRHYAGPDLLIRLPGIRGLQQMVEAARTARPPIPETLAASLDVAIEQFQELIGSLGGSQSRLARRLELTLNGSASPTQGREADSGSRRSRMKLFEAAAELTGRYSNCWVAVYVYRPAPRDANLVELFRAHGLTEHVAKPDAVPLTFHNFTTKMDDGVAPAPGQFFSLSNEPAMGRTPNSVLAAFTSDPAPVVSSKQPNEYLVQSIDENASTSGRPVDLMLATRTIMPHPASQPPPIEEAWALVNFPCRHLLFDIYLHRDLARACIPSLDTHLWRPDFAQHTGDRWQTRFTESPTLQILGPGIRAAPTPAYPRMNELTRHLFGRVGLDAGEYVGFRCEVEYPIWRAGYCVSFDFTKTSAVESA